MLAAVLLAACDDKNDGSQLDQEAVARARATDINPASLNCKKAGGILTLYKRPDGSDYGICNFNNGLKCEEWAMLLNYCPPGGIDVSQLPDEPARYCALHGGRFHPKVWGDSGPATCDLPGNVTCKTDDFYKGTCGTTIGKTLGH